MANVAVVGPGAIGSVVAAGVQQTGRHRLMLCARRDPGLIGPIRVWDEAADETVSLSAPLLTSPSAAGAWAGIGPGVGAEADGPVDWVLLAVKAHQSEGAAGYLAALCGAGTRVVVLQNGVEHVSRVAPLVGEAEVLSAIVWVSAEATEPGFVKVGAEIRPLIQVPAGDAGEAFAALMDGGLVKVEPVEDFTTAVWRKLTTNAIAGLLPITGRRGAIYRRDDIYELALKLAYECLAVARAEGAALDDSMAKDLVDHFVEMPPETGSSILFDRLAGRPLEWDARNGVVQRFGRVHGVPTPVSDVIVPLLAAASEG